MKVQEVRDRLRAACAAAGTARAWAAQNGLSSAYISDVMNGRRDPGDSVLRALGLRRVTSYEPAQN